MIYNQDCLTTMSSMDDKSVDVVVTSPPYNMNLRISNGKYCSRQIVKEFSTKYENFDDNLPIEKYYEFHLGKNIQVSGRMIKNMAKEYSLFLMEGNM